MISSNAEIRRGRWLRDGLLGAMRWAEAPREGGAGGGLSVSGAIPLRVVFW